MNEGHIAIIVSILVGFVAILRFLWAILDSIRHVEKKIDIYSVEHEMLMYWYAEEHNVPLQSLPTRSRLKTEGGDD